LYGGHGSEDVDFVFALDVFCVGVEQEIFEVGLVVDVPDLAAVVEK
jgi:hypothetical protein